MDNLNQVKMQRLMLKGVIADMPEEARNTVNAAQAELQAILDKYPDLGAIAMAMLVCEISIQQEEKKA